MRRVFLVLAFMALLLSSVMCSTAEKAATITVEILGGDAKEKPVIYLADGSEVPVELQEDGRGSVELLGDSPFYAKIGNKYFARTIWVEPGGNMTISFNSNRFYDGVSFAGKGSDINAFINGTVCRKASIDDTKLEEGEFVCYADSLLKENLRKLDHAKLPEYFKEKERRRLVYYTYQILPSYGHYHYSAANDSVERTDGICLDKMHELAVQDAMLLQIPEYQSFIMDVVFYWSEAEYPSLKGAERMTAFVENEITDTSVAEFIVNNRTLAYINRYGLDKADGYLNAFAKFVKNEQMVRNMNLLVEMKGKCRAGSPSPDFKATDVDGKLYTLSNFKGKYVYIDIWATWCGPCRKQGPYLSELEHKFKDDDICFISLSCDSNRNFWEKTVRSGEVGGIQLILEPGCSFMDDYSVGNIPRFILLDKEGRIINPKMGLPSDPQTAEFIAKLLKDK